MGLKHSEIQGILKAHQAKAKSERTDWDRWRAWYAGDFHAKSDLPHGAASPGDEDAEVSFETNYPFAFIDTMIANICPQNPQITVLARQEEFQPAARFREALVNDVFQKNRLHEVLWKGATHASICGRALTKVVWSFQTESAQVFDVDPRCVFFDMSAARWDEIRYLVEVTVLTQGEFDARSKPQPGEEGEPDTPPQYDPKVSEHAKFGGYPVWLRDPQKDAPLFSEASLEVYKWVTVYEVYDFEDDKYFHVLEGVVDPLFEGDLPYKFVRNPFSLLTFNENMVDLGGLSDIKLISGPQERLNEIDTLELWHAHTSTPVVTVNGALVDNPEALVTALRDANKPGAMVLVEGKQGAPINDIIGSTPVPSFSPEFREMRERCNLVIEFILGIPQYSRGVVGVADVATEVALADTATRTRNGRRIKRVEDVVVSLSDKTMGLYEEFLPEDTELPVRITGSQKVLQVTRETLQSRNERTPHHPMAFDYIAVPYSPTENHRLVQLQKIEKYWDILQMMPEVDKSKLVLKLLDLLGISDIVADPEVAKAQAAAMAPPAPGAPPGGAPPGGTGPLGTDSAAGGGLPPGADVALPPLSTGGAGVG